MDLETLEFWPIMPKIFPDTTPKFRPSFLPSSPPAPLIKIPYLAIVALLIGPTNLATSPCPPPIWHRLTGSSKWAKEDCPSLPPTSLPSRSLLRTPGLGWDGMDNFHPHSPQVGQSFFFWLYDGRVREQGFVEAMYDEGKNLGSSGISEPPLITPPFTFSPSWGCCGLVGVIFVHILHKL